MPLILLLNILCYYNISLQWTLNQQEHVTCCNNQPYSCQTTAFASLSPRQCVQISTIKRPYFSWNNTPSFLFDHQQKQPKPHLSLSKTYFFGCRYSFSINSLWINEALISHEIQPLTSENQREKQVPFKPLDIGIAAFTPGQNSFALGTANPMDIHLPANLCMV